MTKRMHAYREEFRDGNDVRMIERAVCERTCRLCEQLIEHGQVTSSVDVKLGERIEGHHECVVRALGPERTAKAIAKGLLPSEDVLKPRKHVVVQGPNGQELKALPLTTAERSLPALIGGRTWKWAERHATAPGQSTPPMLED